jgi:hypothetical protein
VFERSDDDVRACVEISFVVADVDCNDFVGPEGGGDNDGSDCHGQKTIRVANWKCKDLKCMFSQF